MKIRRDLDTAYYDTHTKHKQQCLLIYFYDLILQTSILNLSDRPGGGDALRAFELER